MIFNGPPLEPATSSTFSWWCRFFFFDSNENKPWFLSARRFRRASWWTGVTECEMIRHFSERVEWKKEKYTEFFPQECPRLPLQVEWFVQWCCTVMCEVLFWCAMLIPLDCAQVAWSWLVGHLRPKQKERGHRVFFQIANSIFAAFLPFLLTFVFFFPLPFYSLNLVFV